MRNQTIHQNEFYEGEAEHTAGFSELLGSLFASKSALEINFRKGNVDLTISSKSETMVFQGSFNKFYPSKEVLVGNVLSPLVLNTNKIILPHSSFLMLSSKGASAADLITHNVFSHLLRNRPFSCVQHGSGSVRFARHYFMYLNQSFPGTFPEKDWYINYLVANLSVPLAEISAPFLEDSAAKLRKLGSQSSQKRTFDVAIHRLTGVRDSLMKLL